MAGLVGYASSDEEDETVDLGASASTAQPPLSSAKNPFHFSAQPVADPPSVVAQESEARSIQTAPPATSRLETSSAPPDSQTRPTTTYGPQPADTVPSQPQPAPPPGPAAATPQPASVAATTGAAKAHPAPGPVATQSVPLGPDRPPTDAADGPRPSYPEPDDDDDDGDAAPSASAATRALLQELTLPRVPNLTMPPSPPGSPPRETTLKFEKYLEAKRAHHWHMNTHLAESKALRNLATANQLLRFIGVDGGYDDPDYCDARGGDGMRVQYETGIPGSVLGWDPAAFPKGAFKGNLRWGQDQVRMEKERERASGRRTTVEFVPAVEEDR